MDVDLMAYGYSRALWVSQYDMWLAPDERVVSREEAEREVREIVGVDEDEEPR
jgi:hypothetical protein